MNKAILSVIFLAVIVFIVMKITPSPIDDILDNPDRTISDRAKDDLRKPTEVLTFFGVQPKMKVFDLFSGGGYYSEIVSRIVGEEGQVISHNNQAYLNLVEKELTARQKDNRLPNIQPLISEANDITIEPNSLDMVLMILTYHDLHYIDNGWQAIDTPRLLTEVFKGLKPGGIVGVVDHVADLGSGLMAAQTLHRIDPNIVRAELEAAGFIFDGEIDVLHNEEDPLNIPMFEKSIRGKTDRFVYRFKKPIL